MLYDELMSLRNRCSRQLDQFVAELGVGLRQYLARSHGFREALFAFAVEQGGSSDRAKTV